MNSAVAVSATFNSNSGSSTPVLTGVVSRNTHAASGAFDLVVDATQALNGAVTVEPRASSSHTIVFQFDTAIASVGTVSVTPTGAASALVVGTTVEVTLTGIADNKRVTVSLANLNNNGFASASASVGFLVGDTNSSRNVDAADIVAIKAKSGTTVDPASFPQDVNLSGAITAADILAAKGRLGLSVP
jgi:hypothetical protein